MAEDVVARVDQMMITSIRAAVKDCSERGLSFASKWLAPTKCWIPSWSHCVQYRAAELLVSIPAKKLLAVPSATRPDSPPAFTSTAEAATDPDLHLPPHPHAPRLKPVPESVRLREIELEAREADFLATAQRCFEHREFPRVVYWLHECRSAKALFLSVYSQYLVTISLGSCSYFVAYYQPGRWKTGPQRMEQISESVKVLTSSLRISQLISRFKTTNCNPSHKDVARIAWNGQGFREPLSQVHVRFDVVWCVPDWYSHLIGRLFSSIDWVDVRKQSSLSSCQLVAIRGIGRHGFFSGIVLKTQKRFFAAPS